jgi:hypothetical protein
MVLDEWQNGVLIAFIIIRKNRESNLHPILQSLSQRMPNDWKSFAIIVDNIQIEINILR